MAHPEQKLFFERLVGRLHRSGQVSMLDILEVGSFDVNGSIRGLFDGCNSYLGVDLVPGPGVDLVSGGHKLPDSLGPFDLAIATEVFEHDRFWRETLARMSSLCKPGGAVLVTCATTGRPEHGTSRTDPSLSPGTSQGYAEHYKNVTEKELRREAATLGFSTVQCFSSRWSSDLFFIGTVGFAGEPGASVNHGLDLARVLSLTEVDIAEIRNLMPWYHRVVRLPLLAIAFAADDKTWGSNASFIYWKFVDQLSRAVGVRAALSRDL